MNVPGETGEHLQPGEGDHPKDDAGRAGKYLCLRCGWRWSPRPGFPDPPTACSRCRTAYWSTSTTSRRANRPDDPRWKGAVESVKPALLLPDCEELPLRGDELAKIVLSDVAKILSRDARLSPLMEYPPVSYHLRVCLDIKKPADVEPPRLDPPSGH